MILASGTDACCCRAQGNTPHCRDRTKDTLYSERRNVIDKDVDVKKVAVSNNDN